MTTIRTTCNRCGDVELTTADLALELTAIGGTGHYRFDCPFCDATQRRVANHRVVSILLATGVRYEVVSEDTPITEQEIAAFVKALDGDDWYSRLTASS
jgi:hypothetical protein